MTKFHKLQHNGSDFPHISNVDVYKYDNDFDYQRFNATQMDLQVCSVPWDVGEAHIGARTISGIGNVVYFETKEKRDAWFDAIPDSECYRFTTKYKELHRAMMIDVPIPYDMCAKHNYLRVKYNLFANDDSPVMYEGDAGVREWFWFIREVEFVAPNTTRLHLLDDAFQTWIYDIEVRGMILERGHAPMLAMRASEYLENPIDNNEYLLTEDVNFGDASQVKHTDVLVLNANDMYACIATTAYNKGNWGTVNQNDWKTPARTQYFNSGVPSVYVFAVKADDLPTFLLNVTQQYPNFKQAVQGVFFASGDLLNIANSYTFADVTCYEITAGRKELDLCELNKGLFGYPSRYADIAKLYTSPYAHIEITDENGDVDIVRIEDTTGTIDVSAMISIAYPFVNIETHLMGVGGKNRGSITYRNVTPHTFNFGGQWYDTLKSWKVPTFAVVLDAATEYSYSSYFDRQQRVVDYQTAYDNAEASATTAKTNADATANANYTNALNIANATQTNTNASADTTASNVATMAQASKNNQDASADVLVTNTAIQTAANSTITNRSNQAAVDDAYLSNQLSIALNAWEVGYTVDTTNDQVDAAYASAAIGAAGGAVSAAASGAMSGAALGPAGAAAGAIGGLVSGAIGGVTSMAQTAVAANLTTQQANATITLSDAKVNETTQNNDDRTDNQNDANTDNVNTSNTASTGASANSAATMKANATRTQTAENATATATQTTEKANATRSRNAEVNAALNTRDTALANNQRDYNTAIANAGRSRTQAQSAIANDVRQAGLRSPFVFGAFADGDTAATKPMALFANIVTQSKSAISSAGDEFLRYGYRFDKQWPFDGNWNKGKYFTYWKLRDFWVTNLNVPDMYMDKIRFFLFGGVTIWRKPEDIGNKSIYDNF